MKNPKLTIIGLMMCSFFSGCKSEKEQVRDNIEQMKSRPIELCLDKMECRRNPLSKLGKEFTMVVYVDSAVCSPCALGKLRFWNPLISEAKKERIDIDYVFILSPKKEELEDVNMELEITDLNRIYLEKGFLNVELLGQGFTWLDTGTHESLVDATNFVKTVEQHQHRKIACLEEIAYLNGWISRDELMEVYEVMKKNQYGQYLKDVMDGKYQEHLY